MSNGQTHGRSRRGIPMWREKANRLTGRERLRALEMAQLILMREIGQNRGLGQEMRPSQVSERHY